jgi:3-deoxy-D-manno-octulosonic-acid transferase
MRTIYNILFSVFFVLSAPYYFFRMWRRGNWREGFGERFGQHGTRIKHAITNRHVIWLHAVSVGEVNICTQLIKALEPRVPNLKILVSTTTTTGMAELQRKLPGHVEKIYYPIDRRKYVRRSLGTLRPEAIVLIEAEIWPNFIWHARDRGIPMFLVNARLSEKSYRGYKRFGILFSKIFASFKGVGVQNEADAERLLQLGCNPAAVHVVGNLKFDAAKLDERRLLDVPALLRQLGVKEGAAILVGGSTHAGEEAALARAYLGLKAKHPNLFLVIVPRHFERGKEAGQALAKLGVKFVYRSDVTASRKFESGAVQCLLVNSTGELKYFYEHASVIFVGKSLAAKGGQNPIEPGALGKPMIFGPNMQNFEAVARSFVTEQGAIQVSGENELEPAIDRLLSNPQLRDKLGQNALKVVQQNRGAMDRTVDMIVAYLAEEDVYIAEKKERPPSQ